MNPLRKTRLYSQDNQNYFIGDFHLITLLTWLIFHLVVRRLSHDHRWALHAWLLDRRWSVRKNRDYALSVRVRLVEHLDSIHCGGHPPFDDCAIANWTGWEAWNLGDIGKGKRWSDYHEFGEGPSSKKACPDLEAMAGGPLTAEAAQQIIAEVGGPEESPCVTCGGNGVVEVVTE